ncbi:MAG: phosphoethanolamine transferase [Epsilonproteobacteria bacterium]|nr:hypothetical protein [Campylobacterota bacterium]NPA57425.1 phosphoethanolamine transferase [Campylobacterota bacterium]
MESGYLNGGSMHHGGSLGGRILSHLLWGSLIFLVLILPDLLFLLWEPHYLHLGWGSLKGFGALWLLSLLILAVSPRALAFLFFLLIALLGVAQEIHFAFFHSYIKPYEIPLLFSQGEEIIETLSKVWSYLLPPLLLLLLQLSLIGWLLWRSHPLQWRFMGWVVALLLVAGPVVAHKRKRAYVFMPKAHVLGAINSYTTISWFLGKELFREEKEREYPPYRVEALEIDPPQNIIVIMGESLNERYMSLFGFPKDSTPKLRELARRDSHFLYQRGWSCGVTTDVALPTFFLLKREPDNRNPLIDNRSNLAALAKRGGFRVHFITMQNPMLLSGYIGGFTDEIVALKGYDGELLKKLEEIDFGKRNFIILHQRNSHSPYENYTPPDFWFFPFQGEDFHSYMFHSYLNSLRYTDSILSRIFQLVQDLNSSAVAFFTSDHGEMMGFPDEGGRYGHVVLDFADARVPFLIYYNDQIDPRLLPHLQKVRSIVSHFQFGKIIANTLGFQVIDPEENGSYYINGVDLLGRSGYLEYSGRERGGGAPR